MVNIARCKMGRAGLGILVLTVALCGVGSCGGAPTPFVVNGPGGVGNEAPTLVIKTPNANLAVAQGVPFAISWDDQDRDDNATITFELLELLTNHVVILVSGIPENDTGSAPDNQTVDTSLVPVGSYNLLGIIDDGVNPAVTAFATVGTSATQRVIVQVVGAGQGPSTTPPTVAVIEPQFDRSVTQGDIVTLDIRPTTNSPATPVQGSPVYDPDSETTLFLLLDRDQDPTNDDPFNPDPNQIILLEDSPRIIALNTNATQIANITIDLNRIPLDPDGDPYYVRATISDGQNPSVHSYASGTLSVVQLAAGTVDLFTVGRNTSGAKFQGFTPKANLGSTVRSVRDFDGDGIADFAMVARYGNPQSSGPVGEAYLLYGQDRTRFGGIISVNSISQTLSGVVFQAPPVRILASGFLGDTQGITDVDVISDLNGDQKPELLFGLPFVNGAYDSTDYDPGDDPEGAAQGQTIAGCYPDFIVNNASDTLARQGTVDTGFFSGGMGVMVSSTNRDSDPSIQDSPRLDTTAISLEYTGQAPIRILDTSGFNGAGNIFPRADNTGASDDQIGPTEPVEAGRISGSRFIAGGFDWFERTEGPRQDLFGMNISALSDLTADGLDEIIISAPTNERYLTDLENSPFLSPMLISTIFRGSISILPGTNYNSANRRDLTDASGTAVTPYLDNHITPGSCSNPPTTRNYRIPLQTFEIFAEDIDDLLGGGKSAGDFNQDGIGDILCSAPLNDRGNTTRDSGAAYIIYGRSVFGEIRLRDASDPVLRPPMLRVRGVNRGDQIGLKQAAALDVNGDRVDDVFISSPRTDFGGVTRSQCIGDFNGDGLANASDLSLSAFSDCQVRFGASVFTSDACKAFDYDNDSDIDDADRCVFCCLSGSCSVDSDCINGQNGNNCCENMVDNGFVGVIFGGRYIDGDRDISQIATPDLPGVVFYGGHANDLAGWDISSAGDFNQDGFGDILIATPGETRRDSAGRERLGVVYLIFGGTHLYNTQWNLADLDRGVGSDALPGIVFYSPYVKGRPNEAAPTAVGFIGDINNDGFGDIAIGNPQADFIDQTFPQGPNAPGDDAAAGRRSDAGDVYVIYGNNFGSNR